MKALKSENKVFVMNEEFWSADISGKKISIQFIPSKLLTFLSNKGFKQLNGQYIRIENNIVSECTPEKIYKFTLKYIESLKDTDDIRNAFIRQGETLIMKNKGLLLGLDECEEKFIKDSETTSYKFYQNGIVVISKNKPIKLVDYSSIYGLVWDESIVKRDFDLEAEGTSYAEKFVHNIAGDDKSFESLQSVLGYYLTSYKNPIHPKIVIINDSNDNGESEGGTGKGLLIKLLAQIINVVVFNGKNVDFKKQFLLQLVNHWTNLILFDDVTKNFDFKNMYSLATEDMTIEKKNRDAFILEANESPKIAITTNYTIKGQRSSDRRRRFDVFLANHYSADFTPNDDFNHQFFYEWNELEWKRFDLFMMLSLQKFMDSGLVIQENSDTRKLKLYAETNKEFVELMDRKFSIKDYFYGYPEVRRAAIEEIGTGVDDLFRKRNKRIVEWIKHYADYKGLQMITEDDRGNKLRNNSGNGFKWKKEDHETLKPMAEVVEIDF